MSDESNDRALGSLQRTMVEEFGNIYEGYGLRRLKGLIIGLLLVRDEPVSLDDMTVMLGRSKGPISMEVRELAGLGLIRKVSGPEHRRDYYEAHEDIFFMNFKFNLITVKKNRATAEQFLERMRSAEGGEYEGTLRNLEKMRAYYALMESFYQNFAAEWERVKREQRFDP